MKKGENIVNSVYVQYCYALPLRENQIKCAVLCGIQWSMEFMAPNEKSEGKKGFAAARLNAAGLVLFIWKCLFLAFSLIVNQETAFCLAENKTEDDFSLFLLN